MLTLKLTLALAVATIWIPLALYSALSREAFPKRGLRRAERLLLAATSVLAITWLLQIDYASLWQGDPGGVSAAAAASGGTAAAKPAGSCASLSTGMTASEVRSRMGEPDEVRPNEETRGPGASILVYGRSRCAVHLLDEKIEFIE